MAAAAYGLHLERFIALADDRFHGFLLRMKLSG